MGAGFAWTCDHCGHSVRTSGPWEFYRDREGRRKPYGHPVPISQEAKDAGVSGLSGELYCPNCDEVFDVIRVEFKRPTSNPWSKDNEPTDEFKGKDRVTCPRCRVSLLIAAPGPGEKIACPRCKVGTFLVSMPWIS
jgi:uncharacterized protein YbaR (Trm112 family)